MQRFLCCISRRDWAAQSLRRYASLGAALSQAVLICDRASARGVESTHSQAPPSRPTDRKKNQKTRKICANALAACKTLAKAKPVEVPRFALCLHRADRTALTQLPFVLETARCKFPAAASRPAQATSSASHLAPRAHLAAPPPRHRRDATRRPPPRTTSAREPRAPPVKHERLRGI